MAGWVRKLEAGYNTEMTGTLSLTRRAAGNGGHIFQASLSSVRQARGALDGLALADDELKERAALVLSELATNALLHAGAPFVLTVRYDEKSVRIEVEDASAQMPLMAPGSTLSGRGLYIVAALSDAWGAERRGEGKVVWAELH